MRILGIDPGYEKLGYAVLQKLDSGVTYVTSGLLKTARGRTIDARLGELGEKLNEVISQEHITHVAMEQLFFFKNAKTVIGVAQAQGMVMHTAYAHGLSVALLTPLQIKQAVTGQGSADKTAVWKMLSLQLTLPDTVADDDESDAIACAYAWAVTVQYDVK